MKPVTTQAVVLRRINYAEADRIITVLSATNGKLSFIAKGARRLKSKLAGGIEPLNLNEMTFLPGKRELSTLVSSQMVTAYTNILASFDKNQQAHKFMFWLYRHLEFASGREYFPILVSTLQLLDNSAINQLSFCYFYLNVFDVYGTSFELLKNTAGQALPSAEAYSFDSESLSFYADGQGAYRQDHIKVMRVLLSLDCQALTRLKVDSDLLDGISQLIRGHPVYSEPTS